MLKEFLSYAWAWTDVLVGLVPLVLVVVVRVVSKKLKRPQAYRVGDPVVLVGTSVWAAIFLLRDRVHWGVWAGLVLSVIITLAATKGVSWLRMKLGATKAATWLKMKFRPEKEPAAASVDPFDVKEWIPAVLWFTYWNVPYVIHWVFYRGIIAHLPFLVATALIVAATRMLVRRIRTGDVTKPRWKLAIALVSAVALWCGALLATSFHSNLMWRTRIVYSFKERPDFLELDARGFRTTSREDSIGLMRRHLNLNTASTEVRLNS